MTYPRPTLYIRLHCGTERWFWIVCNAAHYSEVLASGNEPNYACAMSAALPAFDGLVAP